MNTFFGTKLEMTQTWDANGKRLPVTVVKANPMTVTQVKSVETDGYSAVQIGFGNKKKINKPLGQHLKKSGIQPRYIREIRAEDEFEVGASIAVSDVLQVGDEVIVRGVSKGKGFAGGMKRWGFRGGPKTHGQSDRARAPGSIGQGTDPGRVHKGKKMAGRMGNQQHAIRSLQIVKIDEEQSEVWISGLVPGTVGSVLQITKSGEHDFAGLYQEEEDKTVSDKKKKPMADKESTEDATNDEVNAKEAKEETEESLKKAENENENSNQNQEEKKVADA